MLQEDRISPWSIYDKKLRSSKSLQHTYDKRVCKNVDQKQQNKEKQTIYEDKVTLENKNFKHRHKNQQSFREDDDSIGQYMPHHNIHNVRKDQQKVNKSGTKIKNQLVLKQARFTELQSSPVVQSCFKDVKQLMKTNLLLKLIQKKINEQSNPYYQDSPNGQVFLLKYASKCEQNKKIHENVGQKFVPLGVKRKQPVGLYYSLNKARNEEKIEEFHIKNAKNINQPSYKQMGINKHKSVKLMFIEQIKTMEQLDHSINNLLSCRLDRQKKQAETKLLRPSFRNNGILMQKYNSILQLGKKI